MHCYILLRYFKVIMSHCNCRLLAGLTLCTCQALQQFGVEVTNMDDVRDIEMCSLQTGT